MTEEEQAIFTEVTEGKKSPEFFCDNCEFYPIVPVHGHFECPQCHYKSKCCEGVGLDIE
jgi:hypothetical protein